MNFWKMMYIRWSREDISSWKSIKKAVYMIFPLLIYFLVHDVARILLWTAFSQFLSVCREETVSFLNAYGDTVQGMINGLAILCGVAAVWQAVKNETGWKKQRAGEAFKTAETGNSIEKKVTAYAVLGALAFLSALGLNTLFDLLGITEKSKAFEETANAQFRVVFLAGLILYGILSPLAEEAIFRGLIYNRMKRCFNYPIALMASSLLFGCYHGNMVQAVYGTLLGILIAYAYEKYESFAAPVLFHAVANVSIFTLISYCSPDRKLSWGIVVLSLAGAGVCFRWISNRVPGN